MINLIIGLLSTIISNILIGTSLAKINGIFEYKKFKKSIFKYMSMLLGILFIYIAGSLNENIIIAEIDGISLNLIVGIKILFTYGFIYYGGQSLIKLKKILGISININLINDSETK